MVTQNRDKLNTASSLMVNGHHRVPPHSAAWSLSNPLGAGATELPPISLRFSPLLAEFGEVQNPYEMVAHEEAGNLPAVRKLFRVVQPQSGAVRLLRPSLTQTTARSRIIKQRSVDRLQFNTENNRSQ